VYEARKKFLGRHVTLRWRSVALAEVTVRPLRAQAAAAASTDGATHARTEDTLGRFASILLDGSFLQTVVAAPDFTSKQRSRMRVRHYGTCSDDRIKAPSAFAMPNGRTRQRTKTRAAMGSVSQRNRRPSAT
jgi:hypothetical protein